MYDVSTWLEVMLDIARYKIVAYFPWGGVTISWFVCASADVFVCLYVCACVCVCARSFPCMVYCILDEEELDWPGGSTRACTECQRSPPVHAWRETTRCQSWMRRRLPRNLPLFLDTVQHHWNYHLMPGCLDPWNGSLTSLLVCR